MRAWQRMLSGRRLDLIDPAPVDVEVEDIAHGLSRVARWNGQTHGDHAFSVAQHSLLVEEIGRQLYREMDNSWHLAFLLHDAPEYVIGDLISPFKAALGVDYKHVENRLLRAIHIRFGLPGELEDELTSRIKGADHAAAWLEATQLAGFSLKEATQFFGDAPWVQHPPDLTPCPPETVKHQYLARFQYLLDRQ